MRQDITDQERERKDKKGTDWAYWTGVDITGHINRMLLNRTGQGCETRHYWTGEGGIEQDQDRMS